MIRGGRRLFPVALYATLLAALCCLAAPGVPRRVQGIAQSVLCLPLRTWAELSGDAAETGDFDRHAAAVADKFWRRVARDAMSGTHELIPAVYEPTLVRVVDRGESASAGLPAELWLGIAESELRGVASFVTFGPDLLGFLVPWNDDERARFEVEPPARVVLMHGTAAGRGPRRVPGWIEQDEGILRFVVEPAGRLDEWPLRCTLLEDPYQGAGLLGSGRVVRTGELAADPLGEVPPGLRLGHLQVWGYPGRPGSVPIGLYVEPVLDARAVSAVVVWRRRDFAAPIEQAPARRVPVRRLDLPAPPPAEERWALSAGKREHLPEGAAVVRGAACFGVIEQGGPGFGLASPFGRSRRRWSLMLLPDAPGGRVVHLVARGAGRMAAAVRLEVEHASEPLTSGVLFTGANGPHCPAGLLVGRADLAADGGSLLLTPVPPTRVGFSVCVGAEVTPP